MKSLNFKLFLPLLACLWLFVFSSCDQSRSDDDLFESDSRVTTVDFRAQTNFDASSASLSARAVSANIDVTAFLVNIAELELELDDDGREEDKRPVGNKDDDDDDNDDNDDNDDDGDDDDWDDRWDDDGYYDDDDEVKLGGPFELDLLSGDLLFTSVDIPDARYEELEFKFYRSRVAESPLFGKTVLIQGTVDGIPFEFWHSFEEEVEIDFEDNELDLTIDSRNNEIIIHFDLMALLNPLDGENLLAATDGNNDGLIEISPEDPDGNQALAEEIRKRFKNLVHLLDE